MRQLQGPSPGHTAHLANRRARSQPVGSGLAATAPAQRHHRTAAPTQPSTRTAPVWHQRVCLWGGGTPPSGTATGDVAPRMFSLDWTVALRWICTPPAAAPLLLPAARRPHCLTTYSQPACPPACACAGLCLSVCVPVPAPAPARTRPPRNKVQAAALQHTSHTAEAADAAEERKQPPTPSTPFTGRARRPQRRRLPGRTIMLFCGRLPPPPPSQHPPPIIASSRLALHWASPGPPTWTTGLARQISL